MKRQVATKDDQILVMAAAASFDCQVVLPMVAVAEAVLPRRPLLAAMGLRSQQLTLAAVSVVGWGDAVAVVT